MAKIILTQEEISVAKKQLAGKYDPFSATPEEMTAFNSLIDKADAHCAELDAYEEINGDLLKWFMARYDAQEAEAQAV